MISTLEVSGALRRLLAAWASAVPACEQDPSAAAVHASDLASALRVIANDIAPSCTAVSPGVEETPAIAEREIEVAADRIIGRVRDARLAIGDELDEREVLIDEIRRLLREKR